MPRAVGGELIHEGTMDQNRYGDVQVVLIRFFDTALVITGLISTAAIAILMF
jgi:hypothetical protein